MTVLVTLKTKDALVMGCDSLGSVTRDLVDPFDGQKDIDNKLIKAVGNANDRFMEDALRMMRAVRIAAELGLQQCWFDCKVCKACVVVYDTPENITDLWGKVERIGLCENCIRQGKEPNNKLLPPELAKMWRKK